MRRCWCARQMGKYDKRKYAGDAYIVKLLLFWSHIKATHASGDPSLASDVSNNSYPGSLSEIGFRSPALGVSYAGRWPRHLSNSV